MSYGKTCERKTGSSISPITADNQELLVSAGRAPRLCQQLLPPACSPTPHTAFPVILVKVWAEGLCWWVNTAELHFRERNFLSTKWIQQEEKKKVKIQRKLHSSAWVMLLSSDILCHNRTVQGLGFWWTILDTQWHYNTSAIKCFYFWKKKKSSYPLALAVYFTQSCFTPLQCCYMYMAARVFSVQPSSASAYLLIIICCAIKCEWGLWPEDFYMAVQVLTTSENLRCCPNNSNIISGISCHLINVRRLSIASMIYGCENTEWFVK